MQLDQKANRAVCMYAGTCRASLGPQRRHFDSGRQASRVLECEVVVEVVERFWTWSFVDVTYAMVCVVFRVPKVIRVAFHGWIGEVVGVVVSRHMLMALGAGWWGGLISKSFNENTIARVAAVPFTILGTQCCNVINALYTL